jgi:hypothetical protein
MVSNRFHLAQFNIARALAPLDDPLLHDFVGQLDAVNGEAESSPGFVWRLKGDGGAPSSYLRAYPDPQMLINLTVWESIEALHSYTYRSGHADVYRQRKHWFESNQNPSFALWWVPAGHIPTIEEGRARLEHLWEHGPTQFAFTFRRPFRPPETT